MRLSAPDLVAPVDLAATDLADPALYSSGRPHAVWRVLRERGGLWWQPVASRGGFWAVTRYEDARRVMLDSATFSSTGGVFLNLLGRSEPAQGLQFASTDPPRHGRLRSPLQHEMTVTAVRRHLAATRSEVANLLDIGGDVDLAGALSPLPMVALGPLLGIPRADWPRVMRLVMMAVAEEDPEYVLAEGADATLERARRELFAYLIDLVRRQLREPRNNLVKVLATMEPDGERLRPGAVVANAYSIVLGAGAALPHVSVAGLLELARTGRYRECAERPEVVPTLVEEALRWSAPAQHFMRIATRPADFGPTRVQVGEAVVVWLGSANRDDAAFRSPNEFDPWRRPNRHIAFGNGAHYCIGNAIARLALHEVLRVFFERFVDLRTAGEVTHLHSTWLAGYARAPVVVSRRRSRSR